MDKRIYAIAFVLVACQKPLLDALYPMMPRRSVAVDLSIR
jgi:hypothetical protein